MPTIAPPGSTMGIDASEVKWRQLLLLAFYRSKQPDQTTAQQRQRSRLRNGSSATAAASARGAADKRRTGKKCLIQIHGKYPRIVSYVHEHRACNAKRRPVRRNGNLFKCHLEGVVDGQITSQAGRYAAAIEMDYQLGTRSSSELVQGAQPNLLVSVGESEY